MSIDNKGVIEQLVSDALDTGRGIAQFHGHASGAEMFLAYDATKGFFLVVVPHDQQQLARESKALATSAAKLVELGLRALRVRDPTGELRPLYPNATLEPTRQKPPPGAQVPAVWFAFSYEFKKLRMRRSLSKPSGRARNLPCPCGSGRKYKRCCGKSARP